MKKIEIIVYIILSLIMILYSEPLDMVLVEGGTFEMGSDIGESDEKPVRSISIKDFYIGKYEVTQSQWVAIMDNIPSKYYQNKNDSLPVMWVNWYDAIEFCNKMSVIEKLEECYSVDKNKKDPDNYHQFDSLKYTIICNFEANGYRLPTEAEWEYAAKGGLQSNNYTYSGSNNIDEVGWYRKNSKGSDYGTTHYIGEKKPNELGIYDMSSNLSEWCWDWYSEKSYTECSNTNPIGCLNGKSRVVRGGNFTDFAKECRVVNRHCNYPQNGYFSLGFRVVRSAK